MWRDFILVACVFILLGVLIHRYIITYDQRIATMAFDGQSYLVRDTPYKQETADALARLNARINQLIDYVNRRQDAEFVVGARRLKERYKPDAISEGMIDHTLTSYTVNKGEKIVFCMRTRDDHDKLYDDNLLFYVAMHELAHIASVTEEHTPEFHQNFDYLKRIAKEMRLFRNSETPVNYCGIPIEKF